jgi:hypothetical protein
MPAWSRHKGDIMGFEIPRKVTVALLALAIAMCAYGVYSNEQRRVERKADDICMQCIGLG